MPEIETPQEGTTTPIAIATCPECQDPVFEDQPSSDFEGNTYHSECLEDVTYNCFECGTLHREEDSTTVQPGRHVCPGCMRHYGECESCESRCRIRSMRSVLGDHGVMQVCATCFECNCMECEDCGNLVHEDGHECNNSNSRNCRAEEGAPVHSARSARFETRLVGIEFETAHAQNELFSEMRKCDLLKGWTWHRDGSLNGGGMEIVSNPIGGGVIEDKVRAYYRLCESSGSTIQGQEAGGHVHVNAKDIFEAIYENKDYFTTDLMDTAFKTWGNALLPIVRGLVSKNRRNNSYCSGGFAGRDCINWKMQGKTKLGVASYPTIAIRQDTIEFRIWPSTNNVESMLARIEFSQKAVEVMYRCITRSTIREHRSALKAFNAGCAEFASYLDMPNLSASPRDSKEFRETPAFVSLVEEANRSYRVFCRMLGISRQGSNQLSKIFNRFAFNNNSILITKTKSTIDGAE